MITRRAFTQALAASPLALAGIRSATASESADKYPSRAVRFVVGFPPGQASDVGARLIADATSKVLKQSIYVDNRVGAAGIIAHQYVKNEPADGYTLLYGSTGTLAINPALYKKLPYNPREDFEPIILLNESPMFLVTNMETPVHNLEEMIAYVKSKSGEISYGSSGYGVTQHIAMEMLKRQTGMQMLHVPYKGSSPMMTDLIGGRVQFAFDTSTAVLPHIQAGRVRALGISVRERLPQAKDIPTLQEQGLKDFEASTWAGVLARKSTPRPIIDKMNSALNEALKSKEAIAHYHTAGSSVRGGTADDFARFLAKETQRWGEAVKASGAHID